MSKGRAYTLRHLDRAPSDEEVGFDVIGGTSLLRKAQPRPSTSPKLPRGRPPGSKSRGWTKTTRRTNRQYLEENRTAFQSMIHLSFDNPERFCDCATLKEVKKKLVRWFRRNLEGPDRYHWILEFKNRSFHPHFHVCVTTPPTAQTSNLLKNFWKAISGGGKVIWDTRLDDVAEAIARYAQKSDQKQNPPWFEESSFQPYGHNFRKKNRPRINLSRQEAQNLGLLAYKFTHGGVSKLSLEGLRQVSPLSPFLTPEEMSPLSPFPSMVDNDDTPVPYTYPSTTSLMAQACHTCWHDRIRYIPRPRNQSTCEQCGEVWQPAIA